MGGRRHSAVNTSECVAGILDALSPVHLSSILQLGGSVTLESICCSTGWLTHWGEGETAVSTSVTALQQLRRTSYMHRRPAVLMPDMIDESALCCSDGQHQRRADSQHAQGAMPAHSDGFSFEIQLTLSLPPS